MFLPSNITGFFKESFSFSKLMDQNSFHSVHITRASEFLVAESGFLHSLYFLDLGIL